MERVVTHGTCLVRQQPTERPGRPGQRRSSGPSPGPASLTPAPPPLRPGPAFLTPAPPPYTSSPTPWRLNALFLPLIHLWLRLFSQTPM